MTGGFRSSLHQLRGTKVKREQVKLDRQTVHVKKTFSYKKIFSNLIYFKSALALISVNVSSVKENVDNEYRRLTQVGKNEIFFFSIK